MAEGRIRLALGLTIIGAASLMAGLIMILVGETLRLKSAHSQGLVAGGEIAAICGLASGLALLIVLIVGPVDRPARRRGPGPPGAGPVAADQVRGSELTPLHTPAQMIRPQQVSAPPAQMPAWPSPPPFPTPQPDLPPLPQAGFVPPATTPPPEPAVAAWAPSGYPDEGWNPAQDQGPGRWGEERWDPRAGQDWDAQAGPGWRPDPEGAWNPGRTHAWHATGADDWDSGEAGARGPDEYDGWPADGHDGWSREAWPRDGGGGWDADGHDGWVAPGQVPGGRAVWAEPVREEWAAGDPDAWVPDGRGGWAHPSHDDRALAAPEAPYLAGPADGHVPAPGGGYVPGPEEGHVPAPGGGYVPGPEDGHAPWPRLPGAADTDEDDRADDDTSPIPVILAAHAPRSAPPPSVPREPEPLCVWEPARPSARRPDEPYRPEHAEPPSADTQEKIEQIKDLYETAEAIGEDALVKHFEQLKTRQRSLIREFFEKAGLGPANSAHPSQHAAGESAPDGASVPR